MTLWISDLWKIVTCRRYRSTISAQHYAPTLAGSVTVRAAAATRDPKQRIVITGIGICSVHGNDPDAFYSK